MPVLKFVTHENTFEGLGGEGAKLALAYRAANAYWLGFESGSIDTTVVSAAFAGADVDGAQVELAVQAIRDDSGAWSVVGAPTLQKTSRARREGVPVDGRELVSIR